MNMNQKVRMAFSVYKIQRDVFENEIEVVSHPWCIFFLYSHNMDTKIKTVVALIVESLALAYCSQQLLNCGQQPLSS